MDKRTRIFPKKICKWPISTWKGAQYHQIIKEMQIKTIMKQHFTLKTIATNKNEMTSVGKDVERLEPQDTLGGNVNQHGCCGKPHDSF